MTPEEEEAARLEEEKRKQNTENTPENTNKETSGDKKEDNNDGEDSEKEEDEDGEININLEDRTRDDLRALLKLRGLKTSGLKPQLIARLQEALDFEKENPGKKHKDPDKEKVPPDLEEIERKLNLSKVAEERKEQQMKKIQQQLETERKNKKELLQEKKKLLANPSPANTEKIKNQIRKQIEKKKKQMKNPRSGDEEDDEEDEDEGNKKKDDEDNFDKKSVTSKYSQAFSIFNTTPLTKIVNCLDRAESIAKKAIEHHAQDKEVLKSARKTITDAINYASNNADKVEDVSEEIKEETEATISDLEEFSLKIDVLLSEIDKVRAEKSTGVKPQTPQWNPSYPSSFLSFHKAFRSLYKHQDQRIKCEAYRAAIQGPERRNTLRLIASVEDDFKTLEDIMMKNFGCIKTLLPGERARIENLKNHPSNDEDERGNLLAIMEYYHLLQSHEATEHFDEHLMYIVKTKLSKHHMYDLRIRKPKNQKAFIDRLESYLTDITEHLRVLPSERKSEKNPPNEKNGRTNGHSTHSYSTDFSGGSSKKKCGLCGREDSHRTSECNLLRNKNVDQIKSLFREKNRCHSCLAKLGDNHKTGCEKYFHKAKGKKVWRTCSCKSGLNYFLCCHRDKKTTAESSTPRSSGSSDGAPGTTSNSVNVVAPRPVENKKGVVLNNSAGIGEAVTNSQYLNIKIPGTNFTKKILAIYDSQSQNCIFSQKMIRYIQNYKSTTFTVKTMNNSETVRGGLGEITVIANGGQHYGIKGLVKPMIHNSEIKSTVFKIPPEWRAQYDLGKQESTDGGEIDVVIGTDLKNYFPKVVASDNGVDLEMSFFDKKLILSGFNANAVANKGTSSALPELNANRITVAPATRLDQKWIETMNPNTAFIAPGLCPKHRNEPSCVECKNSIQTKTRVQIHEEHLLGESLTFKPSVGRWEVSAPYKANILEVPDYEKESAAATERLTRRLRTMGDQGAEIASGLDEAVNNNLKSGLWDWEENLVRENKDFEKFQPIRHPINFSLKDDALSPNTSTKIRLVHNLSVARPGKSSFNECQLTGTSLNMKIHLILLRQRSFKYQSFSDLKKFYNQVLLSPSDMRKHSFLYKPNGILSDDELKPICSKVLLFGARMSQHLANLAKIRTSEKEILPVDPQTHADLLFSYTDDVTVGSNLSLSHLEEKKRILEEGLNKGGFTLKPWTTSNDPNGDQEINISGFASSVLGCFYTAKTDSYTIKANVNFSKKVRNLRPVGDQINTREELSAFIKERGLTKLNCLQAAHQLFDPLGLLLPTKANLSLNYRKLLIKNPELEYQDKIPEDELKTWEICISHLLDAKKIQIPRSVLPDWFSDETRLDLCVFCDGGESASVTRAFVRASQDQQVQVSNLMNTFKLGPVGLSGAPKSEIESLHNSTRIIELVLRILNHLTFSSVYIFSDSKCCLGALQATHSRLKLYFSERVLEIQRVISENNVKVHHISGLINPANYGSKLDLGPNPVLTEEYWDVPFLREKEEAWPVEDYTYKIQDISSLINPKLASPEEKLQCFTTMVAPPHLDINNLISRFTFNKVVGILSCYYGWRKEFRGDVAQAREEAKKFLFKLAAPTEAQISGLRRQYIISTEDDKTVLVARPFTVGGQIQQRRLQLLDGTGPLGRSLLRAYHVHCCNTERELSKIFSDGLFLVGARSYLKKIQKSCKTCFRIRRTTMAALQGPSPAIEASSYPSYHRAVADIVGPVFVRGRSGLDTRKTQKRRAYILSLTCVWSRHLSLTILDDLRADTFLSGLLTISQNLGGSYPQYLHSDYGTNIVTIKNLNGETCDETEAGKISRQLQLTLRSQGISLVLSSPHAAWRQGAVERLHRNLKLSLKRAGLFHQTQDITRWNFILSKVSFEINQRPLNIRFFNESWQILSPNRLLFGNRQNIFPREINLNLSGNHLYSQLEKLEKDLRNWREMWERSYLEEIQKFLCFKEKSRVPVLQDVVLISDHKNSITGGLSFGQIEEILSDRTVKVKYVKKEAKTDKDNKITKPAKVSYLIRPLRNLVYITNPDEKFQNLDPFSEENVNPQAVPSSSTTSTDPVPEPAPIPDDTSMPTPSLTDNLIDVNVPGNEEADDSSGGSAGSVLGDSDEDKDNTAAPVVTPQHKVKVTFVPDEIVDEIKDITVKNTKRRKRKN